MAADDLLATLAHIAGFHCPLEERPAKLRAVTGTVASHPACSLVRVAEFVVATFGPACGQRWDAGDEAISATLGLLSALCARELDCISTVCTAYHKWLESSPALAHARLCDDGAALLHVCLETLVSSSAGPAGPAAELARLIESHPAQLDKLLGCVNLLARGQLTSPALGPNEARPLCEVLKTLVGLMPDPKKGPCFDPALGAVMQPTCRALIDACAAEHARPTPNFIVMNGAWRLLLRASPAAAAAEPRSSQPPLAVAVQSCLLPALERALARLEECAALPPAAEPAAAAAADAARKDIVTVVLFFGNQLKAFSVGHAAWAADEAARRTDAARTEPAEASVAGPVGTTPAGAAAAAEAEQARKLRASLDASIAGLLGGGGGGGGALLGYWASLACSDPAAASAAAAPAASTDGGSAADGASLASTVAAYGVGELMLGAMRVCWRGDLSTPALDPSASRAVDEDALPAWLATLPTAYRRRPLTPTANPNPATVVGVFVRRSWT